METYRKIRWQASKPWRGTWEFREPGSLRTRVHDDDWAHHKYHRQRFQGTEKSKFQIKNQSFYQLKKVELIAQQIITKYDS